MSVELNQEGAHPLQNPQHAESPDYQITVEYLPASQAFHKSYEGSETVGTVRADAMNFFHVSDHRDRDTHQFFLEFDGRRLTDMAVTLKQLLGHRHGAKFN